MQTSPYPVRVTVTFTFPGSEMEPMVAEPMTLALERADQLRVQSYAGSRAVTDADGEYAGHEPCTCWRLQIEHTTAGWLTLYDGPWEPCLVL